MSVGTKQHQIFVEGRSDVGLVREANEDAWRYLPELQLLVLADGMGGHKAGDVAANETVNRVCNYLKREIEALGSDLDYEEAEALLFDTIQQVNEEVLTLSFSRPQLRGMGTTLCVLLFLRNSALLAHVGDSRIYRLRDLKLEQMTADHSLFQELLDQGALGKGEEFKRKNVITKAIGIASVVEPTVCQVELRSGDRFLLCSDGLSDLVDVSAIEKILLDHEKESEVASSLITAALEEGGLDNITVALATVREEDV